MQPRHFENLANLERQVIKQQFQKVVNPPTLPFGPEPLRDKTRKVGKQRPKEKKLGPDGKPQVAALATVTGDRKLAADPGGGMSSPRDGRARRYTEGVVGHVGEAAHGALNKCDPAAFFSPMRRGGVALVTHAKFARHVCVSRHATVEIPRSNLLKPPCNAPFAPAPRRVDSRP